MGGVTPIKLAFGRVVIRSDRLLGKPKQPTKTKMKLNRKYSSITALAAALLSVATIPATADVVTDWNLITLNATKVAGLNSNLGSRIDAIEAIAVYDAVNSIGQFGTPYHYDGTNSGSAQAAAVQAAHDVLVNYFPSQQPTLDAALITSLNNITDGPLGSGPAAGSAAAADIIALRDNDGSSPNVSYPGPSNPGVGQWRPTPAGFAPGINEQWGTVTPFVLDTGSRFRPGPPPAVGSWQYNQALTEVKNLGSVSNSLRTVDQTHIAEFYKQDAELTVNEAARELAIINGTSLEENALAFALTDIAVADARIAVWDAKYTYLFWRPVTALNANPDGSVTNGYTAWTPLIATPAHPDYPSGHSGTVDAGFTVLQLFFGDWNTLTLHTTTAGEPARTIKSLSQGEYENGLSRIYGGIHFSFDNLHGQALGVKVAAYVLLHGPHLKHWFEGNDDGFGDFNFPAGRGVNISN